MAHRTIRFVFSVFLFAATSRAENPAPIALGAAEGPRVGMGLRVVQSPSQREFAAQVALTLPLGRFALPRGAVSANDAADQSVEGEVGKDAVVPTQRDGSSVAPSEPEVAFPLSLGAFLQLARDTVQHALLTSGAHAEIDRLDDLAARARSSALLPELRLRVARSEDQALRLAPTNDDPYRSSLAGGQDLLLEATATWNLDRLVFAEQEVALSRLRLERDKARAAIIEHVLDQLFVWRRSLVQVLDPGTAKERALEAEFELVDALTSLDVMTGGYFGERLRELGLTDARDGVPRGESAAPTRDTVGADTPDGRTSRFALSTPRDVGRNQE